MALLLKHAIQVGMLPGLGGNILCMAEGKGWLYSFMIYDIYDLKILEYMK